MGARSTADLLEDEETRKKLSKVMAMRPSMSDLEKAGVLQTGTGTGGTLMPKTLWKADG